MFRPLLNTLLSLRGFIAYLVVFFSVWTLRATVFYRIDTSIQSELMRRLYANVLVFVLWVVPVVLYLRFIDNAPPMVYLRLSSRVSRRGLLWTVVIMLVDVLVLLFNATMLGRDISLLWRTPVTASLLALVSIIFSPFCEEMVFRGFVLGKLGERCRFWFANLLAALLFSALHCDMLPVMRSRR